MPAIATIVGVSLIVAALLSVRSTRLWARRVVALFACLWLGFVWFRVQLVARMGIEHASPRKDASYVVAFRDGLLFADGHIRAHDAALATGVVSLLVLAWDRKRGGPPGR